MNKTILILIALFSLIAYSVLKESITNFISIEKAKNNQIEKILKENK